MTQSAVLAIDAGKSGCRAATYTAGRRTAEAAGPGFANVAAPDGPARIRAALEATLQGLPAAKPYAAVCLGLTGVLRPDAHARTVADLLGEVVQAHRVVVTSDVVTNFCGALGAHPGVVVAAGTGTIVLGIGHDGRTARVDGWGYLLDDGGSGFEIGRAGLREALRAEDGRGGSAALRHAALALYGSTAALLDTIYGADNPARTVASFAREVATVAEAGDSTAAGLLERAAQGLAHSAVAAARSTFGSDVPVPLSWNGGVFRSEAFVLAPFLVAVHDALPLVQSAPPKGDALDGAARLAVTVDSSSSLEQSFAGDLLTVAERHVG